VLPARLRSLALPAVAFSKYWWFASSK